MISLEFRKTVDTSGWDQSFVEGGEAARAGLTRGISGPEKQSARRRPRPAFDEADGVDREVLADSRNHSDPGMTRVVTAEGSVLTPKMTTARAVNPFLDPQCQLVTDGRQQGGSTTASPSAPDSTSRRSVCVLDPGQLDLRSRNELPVDHVTAWLDSIAPFETSGDQLNRSKVLSASVCDDTTCSRSLTHDDRTSGRRDSPATWTPDEVPLPAYSRAASVLPAWDVDRLRSVYERLATSGFYLGRMSMDEARRRLAGFPVGTFLLRDSSDARFLFSLSVQTRRGTTSIRILYESGHFRLDSDPDQVHLMPTFDCVLQLVCHYIRRRGPDRPASDSIPNIPYVFRETTGRRDTPVLLRRPLETSPSTLAHICRRRIHGCLGRTTKNIGRLHLRPSLKTYLADYPYDF